MGDDCVNIHGDYHLIMSAHGKELRVLAKDVMNIEPGDPVELVSYEGQRLPAANVTAVSTNGLINEAERAFLFRQSMDAGLKAAQRALTKAYIITLDHEVNLPMGSLICAANRVGNGFLVQDCTFGFNRSRGILIKASHGEVRGNHLEGSWMSAILVTPEYWWLEGGSSDDVKITGNSIRACKGVAICVEAAGGSGAIARAGTHRDITITGNTVMDCLLPGIMVTSTAGLRLENNTLALRADTNHVPELMRRAGLTELQPVVKINCEP
jgi:parallel beta-helix repeat protein